MPALTQFTGTRIQGTIKLGLAPQEELPGPLLSHFWFPMAFSTVGLRGEELVTWGPGFGPGCSPNLLCDLRRAVALSGSQCAGQRGPTVSGLPIIGTLWGADKGREAS